MTSNGLDQRTLAEIFTDLRDGVLQREAVQVWACSQLDFSHGSQFPSIRYPTSSVCEREAFYALSVVASREAGGWFFDRKALALWVRMLREHPLEWPIRDGWMRTPHTLWPRRSGFHLGWLQLTGGRHAATVLGTPLKSWWDLDKYESWSFRAPGGQRFALHRYVPDSDQPSTEFDLIACAEDWDLPRSALQDAATRLFDTLCSVEVPPWCEVPAPVPPRWSLWRTDDNGLDFHVSDHLTEASADRACAVRSQTTHKQWFWVTPRGLTAG